MASAPAAPWSTLLRHLASIGWIGTRDWQKFGGGGGPADAAAASAAALDAKSSSLTGLTRSASRLLGESEVTASVSPAPEVTETSDGLRGAIRGWLSPAGGGGLARSGDNTPAPRSPEAICGKGERGPPPGAMNLRELGDVAPGTPVPRGGAGLKLLPSGTVRSAPGGIGSAGTGGGPLDAPSSPSGLGDMTSSTSQVGASASDGPAGAGRATGATGRAAIWPQDLWPDDNPADASPLPG